MKIRFENTSPWVHLFPYLCWARKDKDIAICVGLFCWMMLIKMEAKDGH